MKIIISHTCVKETSSGHCASYSLFFFDSRLKSKNSLPVCSAVIHNYIQGRLLFPGRFSKCSIIHTLQIQLFVLYANHIEPLSCKLFFKAKPQFRFSFYTNNFTNHKQTILNSTIVVSKQNYYNYSSQNII